MYIKTEGNTIIKFPYSRLDLKKDNPGVSFPADMDMTPLESYGVHKVKVITPDVSDSTKLAYSKTPVLIDGTWTLQHTVVDVSEDELLLSKLSAIENLRQQHLYTDIDVTFSDGPGAIQFRNDADRTNLSNVATGALAHVVAGAPETLMNYRTEDDVIHVVPALEMLQIAGSVLDAKQSVVDNAWRHKDAVKLLTSTQDIIDYDITTGWS